jgi:ATP-dependent protease La (LON) substrate-binding domain
LIDAVFATFDLTMSMIISEESDVDVDEEALSLDEERTDSSGEGEHEDQTSTVTASLPAPRDHSYLDESHPLLPEDPALSRDYKRHRSSFDTTNQKDAASDSNSNPPNRNRDSFELAVLELRGVVLFPGSTIPIKLQNRSMIQYLGRQIQQCRTHPDVQPKVELGILTISEEHFHNRMEYLDWDARNFSSGFRLQRAQYMYSRMRGQLDQHRPSAQNPRYNENSSSSETVDPYIGRIGTIATIRHTHERTSSRTMGNVWSHYEDTDELVVTAVGTSRFRIINRIDERRFVFLVEELVDYAMARPCPQRLFSRNSSEQTTDDNFDTNIRLLRQSQLAWNVAQLTPLPYYVHQKFSPWCLMEKIRGVLRMNSGRNNLPALGAEDIGQQYLERKSTVCDPLALLGSYILMATVVKISLVPYSNAILFLDRQQCTLDRIATIELIGKTFHIGTVDDGLEGNSENG